VRLTVVPVAVVPIAMNCAVCLETVAVCEAGTMASETSGSGAVGMVTVYVAAAVTTEPSGLVAMAVMAVTPAPAAVATPVAELTAAVDGLLEVHLAAGIVALPMVADWLVRLTVVPEEVVPIAMKLAVWPAAEAACEPGMMASETSGSGAVGMVTV